MTTDQLFEWPEAAKEPKVVTPGPGPTMIPRGDYQLFGFLRSVPGFHLVRSTNREASSKSWCGLVGRVIHLGDEQVPQCEPCETALAEHDMTAKQQVASRRAKKL